MVVDEHWMEDLLRRVGSYQSRNQDQVSVRTTDYKGHIDLVTEVDRTSERKLVEGLNERFPDDAILAEEDTRARGTSGRRWIIDPLDGTTNYVHGHPFYGISVALELEGTLVAGFAYFPELDDFYWTRRGHGAYKNDRKLHLDGAADLSESFLATGFADMRGDGPRLNPEVFTDVLPEVQGIRRGGSAVHDLCALAAGVFDGFWEFSLAPWDVAAGGLMVSEAGGNVTTHKGDNNWLNGAGIVAGTPRIHEALLEQVPDHIPD